MATSKVSSRPLAPAPAEPAEWSFQFEGTAENLLLALSASRLPPSDRLYIFNLVPEGCKHVVVHAFLSLGEGAPDLSLGTGPMVRVRSAQVSVHAY